MTLAERLATLDRICADIPAAHRRVIAIFSHVGARPCPFCGAQAHSYYRAGREPGEDGWATLGCRTDGCRGNIPMAIPPVAKFEQEMARWNRRANHDSTTPVV